LFGINALGERVRRAHFNLINRSCDILAESGVDVCAGDHWAVVMNETLQDANSGEMPGRRWASHSLYSEDGLRPPGVHLVIDCAVTQSTATFLRTDHQRSGDSRVPPQLDLYTLGYQGVDIDTYVRKLVDAGVGVVADVRETPWSHKPGFCKNALISELSRVGIDYVHVKSAGNPKENRRTAPDLTECLRRYKQYLGANPTGVVDLIRVVRAAALQSQTVCLTCFEKDVNDCHRSILVSAIKRKIRVTAVHL
jgi:hypothetical protein